MNVSKKSRLSMSQFLEDGCYISVDKIMLQANDESILELYDEVVRTPDYLKNNSQVYGDAFSERLNDLYKYFQA
jgi:hypothetical protein